MKPEKKLKSALEKAYVEGKLGRGRDEKYERVMDLLTRAKALDNVGDVNGKRIILRAVARYLPNVNLKTPSKGEAR